MLFFCRYLSRIGAALPAHLGLGSNAINASQVMSPATASTPMVVGSNLSAIDNAAIPEAARP